ncbi:hypothetical protein [Mesorhizobium kowhaii]|uniref:Uncharacterized protein n=1 Tax=Mesorhizobium kowhaii TaxID=1300272 RepID=A0A2W7BZQ6_9HYPH|nr:hypothetical protein [Mesorhizobium kowhaii]PZV35018.1 hypothetical protein B5V02_28475 [Mesorhizobium kowhaii]
MLVPPAYGRAFKDEEYFSYPKEELRPRCLALYEKERADGTELPAIIGLLRDHVEREEERLRVEQEERYKRWREEDRMAREQWTQLQKSPHWFCRANGRTYRLSPTKDKMWNLYRVSSVSEDDEKALIGKYGRRGDATKVVSQMAYQPEPRW